MPSSRTALPTPLLPTYPRHSSNGSRRSRANSSTTDVRLSIIIEDRDLTPRPDKTYFHLPFGRRWIIIDDLPRPSFDRSPPKYSLWDATGPKGDRLWEVTENRYISRRGGWRRISLIGLIVAAVVVALVVGLAVGLKKKDKKSAEPTPSLPSASSSKPSSFPVGSYTFTTYLDTVITNCTSTPTDWQCFPYSTYSESPSQSVASYQWIIVDSGSQSSPNLTISSSDNPFNDIFTNTALTLVDAGSDSERYTFRTKFDRVVPLPQSIYCYFYNTTLEGTLYTKRTKSIGPARPSAPSTTIASTRTEDVASDIFAEWKYAVDITQSISGGPEVPECFHMQGLARGARFSDGITPKSSEDFCSCGYKNYDL